MLCPAHQHFDMRDNDGMPPVLHAIPGQKVGRTRSLVLWLVPK